MRRGVWMKRGLLALLLPAVLLLFGCKALTMPRAIDPIAKASSTLVPGVETQLPQASEDTALMTRSSAVLYYRYRQGAYLAPQSRVIDRKVSQTWEYAVVSHLLEGPEGDSELSSLFPQDTRVISAVKQGRTLIVTLSGEVLNAWPDEPVDWRESDYWRRECPLRRRLCMQSLVATVTQNCDVDQVQVLVQQSSASAGDSLRLKQDFFMDDSPDSLLVGPMTRDSGMLLTPGTCMGLILEYWQSRDWLSLYDWVLSRDPFTGDTRPAQRDFVTMMESLSAPVNWTVSDASFSQEHQVATFAVTIDVPDSNGITRRLEDRILRLYSDGSCWLISMAQLTGWTEVAE